MLLLFKQGMSEDANTSLFHYTTGTGLKGILQDKCLWATDFRFTNDGSELKYAEKVLVEEFKKEVPKLFEAQGNAPPTMIKEAFIKMVNEVGSLLGFSDLDGSYGWLAQETVLKYHNKLFCKCYEGIYLTSFCIHTDRDIYHDGLLSQWKGYGTYAIEFDREKLKLLNNNKHFVHSQVYYPTKNSHGLIPDCIERLKESVPFIFKFMADVNLNDDPEAMLDDYKATPEISKKIDQYVEDFALCKALIKHPGFHEECEYRFVVLSAAKSDNRTAVKHREKNGKLIPYIQIFDGVGDEFLETIKRITVGPHRDKMIRAEGVRSMLASLGMNDVPVHISEIPYLGH